MSYSVLDWEYTRFRYWARLMACSSVTAPPIATSRAMGDDNDLVKNMLIVDQGLWLLSVFVDVSIHVYDQICEWKWIVVMKLGVMYPSHIL